MKLYAAEEPGRSQITGRALILHRRELGIHRDEVSEGGWPVEPSTGSAVFESAPVDSGAALFIQS